MVICWCDGGAKPNPGDCYGSFRITGLNNGIITETFEYGYGTNNQAEYWTLLTLLKYLQDNDVRRAIIRMDALLILNQVGSVWAVNSDILYPIWQQVMAILKELRGIEFQYIHNKKMKQILGH